uniref:Uncharacterized protein n=1 Tax=Globisporangium ultimum (strain ATCC 200006 / CBS 805.95 / DAOM BR144) TaxID=431595 RepID=K3X611_GLOUD
MVSARVRAIYHDTGRSAPPIRQMPSSVSATSTIASKLKVFQQAELHDEYYKLVDVVTELKTACQHEQERHMKAVARIRRLEEIIAMKDRKIESLLHAKTVSSDHSHVIGSITQRVMAQKDRQNHSTMQKLRLKIAQQSQILASYNEAMQSLRSGTKSTNLMELEEERNQLYIELRHHQELLACQQLEIESQAKKISELFQVDTNTRQQMAKLQQESKKHVLEKQKFDQEIAILKAQNAQLQDKLVLEQRKRTYDKEAAANSHANGVGGTRIDIASPARDSVLANALEEMKALMKKECLASIQREKL